MPRKSIVLGIAQARQSDHLGRNLQQIARFAEMASKAEVTLLCFPECALTGYGPVWHASSAGFDADAVEAALAEVRGLARDLGIAMVIGAHMPVEGGWANSALLIRSDGRTGTRYDKAHLYGRDVEFYRAGRARPAVAGVKGVRIGLQICFDIRFPEPFRRLSLGGAQLILVPSHIHGRKAMWKGPVMTAHVISRAAENERFVAFANAAGGEQNVPSMIADPRGEIIARCRKGAQRLLVAELDLRKVGGEFLAAQRTDLF